MKKLYVTNLREGLKVEEVFLVASKSVSTTRGGSPYLKLKLADRTGEIDAIKWSVTESEAAKLKEDDYVLVHATVRSYNDSPQLTVDSLQRWSEAVDPADFIRSSSRDLGEMVAELNGFIEQITNPHLRQLLDRLFADENLALKFRQAPAAKRLHHAHVSGLLEHTLNVLRVCDRLAELYPQLDRDLLLTGAILHDIGKVDEYVWTGSIKYSEAGTLVGHIVGGAMMVKRVADTIDGFDHLLSLALQHMILSHHGTREWGAAKLPKSVEAVMLHAADDLDAKVAMYERAIEESDDSGESGLFTKRHFLLNHPIFKGHRTRSSSRARGSEEEDPDLDIFAVEDEV